MDASLPPTSLPLSQDRTGNPNSSSTSSLNFPFSFNDDPIYHFFDFDHNFYYNHNPSPNPPLIVDTPSNQDSSSSSFQAHVRTNEQSPVFLDLTAATNTAESSHISMDDTCLPQPHNFHRDEFNGERVHDGPKISFRIRTELEVLDDGYRWRKYGKKKVKSNPNLRNYYKCSTVGCHVKKRVERDRDDSSYMIATYIGMHNHEIPSWIPCNAQPNGVWTLQLS
ncbi:hypothetical protein L6452_04982 [Arctium lappa]|uniref:Uncharacterized protein n=1 Tax=Arctium lappa TaxID=4217 RepID=A0ACB9EFK3_ARCLA|nr:hypothetical protein L6452_04982 [Arctium lappa]